MSILNITNFDDHPQDPLWMVFRFQERRIAQDFIGALAEASIPFEEDPASGPPFLVGVKQRYRHEAVRANYAVLGKYRTPFIADGVLRWGLIAFVVVLLVIAGIGVMVAP